MYFLFISFAMNKEGKSKEENKASPTNLMFVWYIPFAWARSLHVLV